MWYDLVDWDAMPEAREKLPDSIKAHLDSSQALTTGEHIAELMNALKKERKLLMETKALRRMQINYQSFLPQKERMDVTINPERKYVRSAVPNPEPEVQ